MTVRVRRCVLRRDLYRVVPAYVETVAACAKCTFAVPAKCVSEEEGEDVGLALGAVVVVVGTGVAVVVLAVKAGLGDGLGVEECF